MHIAKGTSRIAIVMPTLRFVVKIPIIRLWKGIRNLPGFIKEYRSLKLIPWDCQGIETIKTYLIKGICANMSEFLFYQETRHPLLQPTWFSLLGLVNIQQYGKPLNGVGAEIWVQLFRVAGSNKELGGANHHFTTSANFSEDPSGKLKMLDYGSRLTQRVIMKFGERLHKEFVFPNRT